MKLNLLFILIVLVFTISQAKKQKKWRPPLEFGPKTTSIYSSLQRSNRRKINVDLVDPYDDRTKPPRARLSGTSYKPGTWNWYPNMDIPGYSYRFRVFNITKDQAGSYVGMQDYRKNYGPLDNTRFGGTYAPIPPLLGDPRQPRLAWYLKKYAPPTPPSSYIDHIMDTIKDGQIRDKEYEKQLEPENKRRVSAEWYTVRPKNESNYFYEEVKIKPRFGDYGGIPFEGAFPAYKPKEPYEVVMVPERQNIYKRSAESLTSDEKKSRGKKSTEINSKDKHSKENNSKAEKLKKLIAEKKKKYAESSSYSSNSYAYEQFDSNESISGPFTAEQQFSSDSSSSPEKNSMPAKKGKTARRKRSDEESSGSSVHEPWSKSESFPAPLNTGESGWGAKPPPGYKSTESGSDRTLPPDYFDVSGSLGKSEKSIKPKKGKEKKDKIDKKKKGEKGNPAPQSGYPDEPFPRMKIENDSEKPRDSSGLENESFPSPVNSDHSSSMVIWDAMRNFSAEFQPIVSSSELESSGDLSKFGSESESSVEKKDPKDKKDTKNDRKKDTKKDIKKDAKKDTKPETKKGANKDVKMESKIAKSNLLKKNSKGAKLTELQSNPTDKKADKLKFSNTVKNTEKPKTADKKSDGSDEYSEDGMSNPYGDLSYVEEVSVDPPHLRTFPPTFTEPYVAPLHHQPDEFWDEIYRPDGPDPTFAPYQIEEEKQRKADKKQREERKKRIKEEEERKKEEEKRIKKERNKITTTWKPPIITTRDPTAKPRFIYVTNEESDSDESKILVSSESKSYATRSGDRSKSLSLQAHHSLGLSKTQKQLRRILKLKNKAKALHEAKTKNINDIKNAGISVKGKDKGRKEKKKPKKKDKEKKYNPNNFSRPNPDHLKVQGKSEAHAIGDPIGNNQKRKIEEPGFYINNDPFKIYAAVTPFEPDYSFSESRPSGNYEWPSVRHPKFDPETAYDEEGYPVHESPDWTSPTTHKKDRIFGRERERVASGVRGRGIVMPQFLKRMRGNKNTNKAQEPAPLNNKAVFMDTNPHNNKVSEPAKPLSNKVANMDSNTHNKKVSEPAKPLSSKVANNIKIQLQQPPIEEKTMDSKVSSKNIVNAELKQIHLNQAGNKFQVKESKKQDGDSVVHDVNLLSGMKTDNAYHVRAKRSDEMDLKNKDKGRKERKKPKKKDKEKKYNPNNFSRPNPDHLKVKGKNDPTSHISVKQNSKKEDEALNPLLYGNQNLFNVEAYLNSETEKNDEALNPLLYGNQNLFSANHQDYIKLSDIHSPFAKPPYGIPIDGPIKVYQEGHKSPNPRFTGNVNDKQLKHLSIPEKIKLLNALKQKLANARMAAWLPVPKRLHQNQLINNQNPTHQNHQIYNQEVPIHDHIINKRSVGWENERLYPKVSGQHGILKPRHGKYKYPFLINKDIKWMPYIDMSLARVMTSNPRVARKRLREYAKFMGRDAEKLKEAIRLRNERRRRLEQNPLIIHNKRHDKEYRRALARNGILHNRNVNADKNAEIPLRIKTNAEIDNRPWMPYINMNEQMAKAMKKNQANPRAKREIDSQADGQEMQHNESVKNKTKTQNLKTKNSEKSSTKRKSVEELFASYFDHDNSLLMPRTEHPTPPTKQTPSTLSPDESSDENKTKKNYVTQSGGFKGMLKMMKERKKKLQQVQRNALLLQQLTHSFRAGMDRDMNNTAKKAKFIFTESLQDEMMKQIENRLNRGKPDIDTIGQLTEDIYQKIGNRYQQNKTIGHVVNQTHSKVVGGGKSRPYIPHATVRVRLDKKTGQYEMNIWAPKTEFRGEQMGKINGSVAVDKNLKDTLKNRIQSHTRNFLMQANSRNTQIDDKTMKKLYSNTELPKKIQKTVLAGQKLKPSSAVPFSENVKDVTSRPLKTKRRTRRTKRPTKTVSKVARTRKSSRKLRTSRSRPVITKKRNSPMSRKEHAVEVSTIAVPQDLTENRGQLASNDILQKSLDKHIQMLFNRTREMHEKGEKKLPSRPQGFSLLDNIQREIGSIASNWPTNNIYKSTLTNKNATSEYRKQKQVLSTKPVRYETITQSKIQSISSKQKVTTKPTVSQVPNMHFTYLPRIFTFHPITLKPIVSTTRKRYIFTPKFIFDTEEDSSSDSDVSKTKLFTTKQKIKKGKHTNILLTLPTIKASSIRSDKPKVHISTLSKIKYEPVFNKSIEPKVPTSTLPTKVTPAKYVNPSILSTLPTIDVTKPLEEYTKSSTSPASKFTTSVLKSKKVISSTSSQPFVNTIRSYLSTPTSSSVKFTTLSTESIKSSVSTSILPTLKSTLAFSQLQSTKSGAILHKPSSVPLESYTVDKSTLKATTPLKTLVTSEKPVAKQSSTKTAIVTGFITTKPTLETTTDFTTGVSKSSTGKQPTELFTANEKTQLPYTTETNKKHHFFTFGTVRGGYKQFNENWWKLNSRNRIRNPNSRFAQPLHLKGKTFSQRPFHSPDKNRQFNSYDKNRPFRSVKSFLSGMRKAASSTTDNELSILSTSIPFMQSKIRKFYENPPPEFTRTIRPFYNIRLHPMNPVNSMEDAIKINKSSETTGGLKRHINKTDSLYNYAKEKSVLTSPKTTTVSLQTRSEPMEYTTNSSKIKFQPIPSYGKPKITSLFSPESSFRKYTLTTLRVHPKLSSDKATVTTPTALKKNMSSSEELSNILNVDSETLIFTKTTPTIAPSKVNWIANVTWSEHKLSPFAQTEKSNTTIKFSQAPKSKHVEDSFFTSTMPQISTLRVPSMPPFKFVWPTFKRKEPSTTHHSKISTHTLLPAFSKITQHTFKTKELFTTQVFEQTSASPLLISTSLSTSPVTDHYTFERKEFSTTDFFKGVPDHKTPSRPLSFILNGTVKPDKAIHPSAVPSSNLNFNNSNLSPEIFAKLEWPTFQTQTPQMPISTLTTKRFIPFTVWNTSQQSTTSSRVMPILTTEYIPRAFWPTFQRYYTFRPKKVLHTYKNPRWFAKPRQWPKVNAIQRTPYGQVTRTVERIATTPFIRTVPPVMVQQDYPTTSSSLTTDSSKSLSTTSKIVTDVTRSTHLETSTYTERTTDSLKPYFKHKINQSNIQELPSENIRPFEKETTLHTEKIEIPEPTTQYYPDLEELLEQTTTDPPTTTSSRRRRSRPTKWWIDYIYPEVYRKAVEDSSFEEYYSDSESDSEDYTFLPFDHNTTGTPFYRKFRFDGKWHTFRPIYVRPTTPEPSTTTELTTPPTTEPTTKKTRFHHVLKKGIKKLFGIFSFGKSKKQEEE